MASEPRASITPVPAKRLSHLVPIVLAISIGGAAFTWLNNLKPFFLPWDDVIRDQLLARDCTDLGQCHLIGASASLAGFYQGAVWPDLLVAVRLLGGDIETQKTVVLVLLALSVATLFLVIWRWLRPSIALPAAIVLIGALGSDPYLLLNPSASTSLDILTAAGLLCYGLSGKRRFLISSAFTLGVGVNAHVGSLSLVPPLVVIAALGRPRPWRELCASIGTFLAVYIVTSRAALLGNLVGLATYGRLLPALVAGFAVLLLSSWLGSWFRRLSSDARAWVIGLILVAPFGLASLWMVFVQGHHYNFTYLHPVLGPLAALAAALISVPFELGARWRRILRWIPSTAALAVVTFAAAQLQPARALPARLSPTWTLADARAIANQIAQRGWSYEDLVFHIQSKTCRELLVGMSLEAPPPGARSSNNRRQVQVVSTTRDSLPALPGPHDVVTLGPGRVAVVREIQSWLDPEGLVACREAIGSGHPPLCSAATHQTPLDPERFLFAARAYPEIHGLQLPPPYVATYEIPLTPAAGETRDLVVADPTEAGCPSWRITHVEGLEIEGQLPADHVRLHSTSGSPGRVRMEKPFGTTCAPAAVEMRYPPCVFELSPDDPLHTVVEAG